jgi:hypothetical protein
MQHCLGARLPRVRRQPGLRGPVVQHVPAAGMLAWRGLSVPSNSLAERFGSSFFVYEPLLLRTFYFTSIQFVLSQSPIWLSQFPPLCK